MEGRHIPTVYTGTKTQVLKSWLPRANFFSLNISMKTKPYSKILQHATIRSPFGIVSWKHWGSKSRNTVPLSEATAGDFFYPGKLKNSKFLLLQRNTCKFPVRRKNLRPLAQWSPASAIAKRGLQIRASEISGKCFSYGWVPLPSALPQQPKSDP